MQKFTGGEDFFKNDSDGMKRVKAICTKAFKNKKPEMTLNMFRDYSKPEKWTKERLYVRKVISETACIAHPVCGSGLSYKLYSPKLHVAGVGSISVSMPQNPDLQESWLAAYNGIFADYQEFLQK